MKTFNVATLFFLAPSAVFAACNADNVLRALQANAPKASPFCSTYTLPPPDQPLPTYVSQYPASRVSSGCSCLITSGPTTLTTSTASSKTPATTSTTSTTASLSSSSISTTPSPTPTYGPGQLQCQGDLIRNGGFQYTTSPRDAPPWQFAPTVTPAPGQQSGAQLIFDNGNNYANLSVVTGPDGGSGGSGSTYITQVTPDLCKYVTYTLSFEGDSKVTAPPYSGLDCTLEITVKGQKLVNEATPYGYRKRSYSFTFGGCPPYGQCPASEVTVRLSCRAPRGWFIIDNISLVGSGY